MSAPTGYCGTCKNVCSINPDYMLSTCCEDFVFTDHHLHHIMTYMEYMCELEDIRGDEALDRLVDSEPF